MTCRCLRLFVLFCLATVAQNRPPSVAAILSGIEQDRRLMQQQWKEARDCARQIEDLGDSPTDPRPQLARLRQRQRSAEFRADAALVRIHRQRQELKQRARR